MTKSKAFRSTLIAVACAVTLSAHAFADSPRKVDIAPGELSVALRELAKQAGVEFIYSADQLKGVKTNGVHGELTAEKAVTKLLEGTALKLTVHETGALLISDSRAGAGSAEHSPSSEGVDLGPSEKEGKKSFFDRFRVAQVDQGRNQSATSVEQSSQSRVSESDKPAQLDEVVVTGTHIRGVQPSSPVITITQEEMRVAGHTNLGEVMRALPQNFSGGQNPGVALGAADGGVSNQNLTGSSSLNLRGLGPSATLTLLNGARLPYDSFVQATDLAVIPTAAIERVEILLDGASAIYGSDAIGGVANIILMKDFEGAELSVRYGVSTEGGNEQTQYTGISGAKWGSGGFLVALDTARNSAVRARDRDYLDFMPNPDVIIYPRVRQDGVLLSGHQDLGANVEITLDSFYTERETDMLMQTAVIFARNSATKSWGVSPGMNVALPGDWSLVLQGAYGENDSEIHLPIYRIATGSLTSQQRTCYCNQAESLSARSEGPLFALPGGEVRVSVGTGYVKNAFESIDLITGVAGTAGSSRSFHAYGELNVPLLDNLSATAALRHEDHDSFGDVTTPKLGLVWDVSSSIRLKASWGKSFKVPTLNEQFQPAILNLNTADRSVFVNPPPGSTELRFIGGRPGLHPERAEVATAGLEVRPRSVPGLAIELGLFDIDYVDRVVTPLQAGVDPTSSGFVILNPSVAQQNEAIGIADRFRNFTGGQYNPGTVIGLLDNRSANAAMQRMRGIDLAVRYTTEVLGWTLTTNGAASWLNGDRRITASSAEHAVVGRIFFPPHIRARAGMVLDKGGLTLASHVNHIGGVDNVGVTPAQRVSSMTTFDVVAEYHSEAGALGDIRFGIAVSNAFDRRPPFARPTNPNFYVNYDSTNYSPLGRVVNATVTKRF